MPRGSQRGEPSANLAAVIAVAPVQVAGMTKSTPLQWPKFNSRACRARCARSRGHSHRAGRSGPPLLTRTYRDDSPISPNSGRAIAASSAREGEKVRNVTPDRVSVEKVLKTLF